MRESQEHERRLPGRAESVWTATTSRTAYPPLVGDVRADRGGIAGITAAALLKEAGLSVVVLEARRVVEGATGNTTAKVTSLHKLIYRDLVRVRGEETARLYGEANQAGIERVARFVDERGIDCDFARADAFTYTESEADADVVRQEADVARRLGLPAETTTRTGLPFAVVAAVKFTDQARFHPRKYLLALARTIPGDGSAVFESTTALDVRHGNPCEVRTDQGRVRAKHVIVATHQPFMLGGLYFARTTLKRSYALALRIEGDVPQGLYISTDLNFRSMRPQPTDGGELLILGGEAHRPGQGGDTSAMVRRLEEWARQRFRVKSIEYRWATQDVVTPDRVPYVGRLTPRSKNVLVATGFSGWGMSNATAGAMLLTDMVLGRENPWQDVYDPARASLRTFVAGLTRDTVVGVKDLLGGFGPKESAPDASSVPAGEGAVVDQGAEKVAVYRDDEGGLHAVSAVCTHLQCIVRWNSADRSWDCPCHGSRFDTDGRVLHGPALSPLSTVDLRTPTGAHGRRSVRASGA
jgi:glycine/D-amino acid oxidase-like deaminating enzyme/nitrite reductase/ring-hydroxylating ferredoxin subunit